MRLTSFLLWTGGVWLMTGIEAASGAGWPGPVFLVAVAAGLWSGVVPGLLIGLLAGACEATLTGYDFTLITLCTMGCAAAASALPRWFAREHLAIGVLVAAVTTLFALLLVSPDIYWPSSGFPLLALRQAGENALWMVPIYGIVLMISRRL